MSFFNHKISSLTTDQQKLLSVYKDKWLKIGLSTEPLDKDKCVRAINLMYKCANLSTPKEIVFASSPPSQINLAKKILKGTTTKFYFCYGSMDADWLSFYDYIQDVLKLDLHAVDGLIEVAKTCGWILPYDNVCIVGERPNLISRDQLNRLHSETGPALSYSDGYSLYMVHGFQVPEKIIMKPETISISEIESENNTEVRRIMVSQYDKVHGVGKYIQDSGAKMISYGVLNGRQYKLYQKEMQGDEPMLMVSVIDATPQADGTFREYFKRVAPDLRPMRNGQLIGEPQELTAINAVASTFGRYGKDYNPTIET